jgi:NADPH-dependent curcumin reductase CurA
VGGFSLFALHSFRVGHLARNEFHKEDVAYGLGNAPKALLRLFSGENFGKQLVKVADSAA